MLQLWHTTSVFLRNTESHCQACYKFNEGLWPCASAGASAVRTVAIEQR